jgi:hypothetical protein
MAFDPGRGRLVLFGGAELSGGLGDTWEYSPSNPATYASFGTGCAGSAGTPVLAPAPWQLPWIGQDFSLQVTRLPPANFAWMLLGRSHTSWGSINLPFDLGFLGMRGCQLLTSVDYAFPVAKQGGSLLWRISVPNDPTLLGSSFHNQALLADPTGNPLGAILSNGGMAAVGSK